MFLLEVFLPSGDVGDRLVGKELLVSCAAVGADAKAQGLFCMLSVEVL